MGNRENRQSANLEIYFAIEKIHFVFARGVPKDFGSGPMLISAEREQ